MTTRFKDFGYGKAVGSKEPLKFKLYDEEFECVAQIQGKVMLDLVSESTSEDAGSTARVVSSFFGKVMLPESFVRFEALTEDPDRIVSVETLSEIVSWLITEYGNRPNQEPEA